MPSRLSKSYEHKLASHLAGEVKQAGLDVEKDRRNQAHIGTVGHKPHLVVDENGHHVDKAQRRVLCA